VFVWKVFMRAHIRLSQATKRRKSNIMRGHCGKSAVAFSVEGSEHIPRKPEKGILWRLRKSIIKEDVK